MDVHVEWNAKDGNLDRHISAIRDLVVGVPTERRNRELGYRLGIESGFDEGRARRILGTTTTTNSVPSTPNQRRCWRVPRLGIFICAKTSTTPFDLRLCECRLSLKI